MTRYVIDPLALLQIAEGGQAIAPEHRLVAPNSLRSDALNLLLQQVVSGGLDESVALERHERITELKIRLLGDRVSRRTAWRIARDHNVGSIRQAEYIAVAKLQADALIAADAELAARARGLVPTVSLADLFTAH